MGSAAPKKRPMRSIRSGIKKLELVKANLAVLKKLAILFIFVFISCEPVRYVMIDPKDTTKLVEIRRRIIYQDQYYGDYNYINTPLYFNYYRMPTIPLQPSYYRAPVIIPQPPVRIQLPPYRAPREGKRQ